MTHSCWQMELSQIYLRGHLLLQTTFPLAPARCHPYVLAGDSWELQIPPARSPCCLFAGEQHLLPRVSWVSASSPSFFRVPCTGLDSVGVQ